MEKHVFSARDIVNRDDVSYEDLHLAAQRMDDLCRQWSSVTWTQEAVAAGLPELYQRAAALRVAALERIKEDVQ